jgi:hypothetical protein
VFSRPTTCSAGHVPVGFSFSDVPGSGCSFLYKGFAMTADNTETEFDITDILAEAGVATDTAAETKTEATLVTKPEAVLPDMTEEKKEGRQMRQAIPSDQKTFLDTGTRMESVVYPAGYVRIKIPSGKMMNQFFVYADQLDELENWIKSDAFADWKAQAVAAGLRVKGQPRQEG